MSIPKDEIDEEPLGISAARVAKRFFGKSPEWFRINRPRLEAKGLPKPHPDSKLYDVEDVKRFYERSKYEGASKSKRTGTPSRSDEAILLERAKKWRG